MILPAQDRQHINNYLCDNYNMSQKYEFTRKTDEHRVFSRNKRAF